MALKTKHLIIAIFSLLLLGSTVFVSKITNNKEEMKKVEFGFPAPFLTQDFSSLQGKGFTILPYYFKPKWGKEFSSRIAFPKLILSYLSIFAGLEILILVLELIKFLILKIFKKA